LSNDLIFKDGFETGSISAWSSSVTDSGDLSVNSSAALAGSTYGLQALLDDNNSIYVTDDTPNAETRLRVRFYFDPNTLTMANGNSFCLLLGISSASNPVICLEFRRQSSYQLRLSAVDDLHHSVFTPWVTLSDAPHFIEFDWRAAFPQGANNGSITLWLDGVQQANITGIDNDLLLIDRVQLGAVNGVDTGSRGRVFFDAYESRRLTYIGP